MHTNAISPPSSADYEALTERTHIAMQSRDAGEINEHAFRKCIDEITRETRVLDLLCKLHHTRMRLAAQEKKALSSSSSRVCAQTPDSTGVPRQAIS